MFEESNVTTRRKKFLVFAILTALIILPGTTSGSVAAESATGSESDIDQDKLVSKLKSLHNYTKISPSAPSPRIFAGSYLLMDSETGDVLIESNGFESRPVASTTKMVTALTALELFKPAEIVTVSQRSTLAVGSTINLVAGEQITILDLIKGLLIESGNDAAMAIAEHYSRVPGEASPFVKEMNNLVKRNDLKVTTFADPAGLSDEFGRSSAFELAHISRLLLKNPLLSEIVATPETTVVSVDGSVRHELKSSNRLILPDSPYYLPQAVGIKTGYMPEAGHCLVAAYRHGDRLLIGVVLRTNESSITASAKEMRRLLLWADRHVKIERY